MDELKLGPNGGLVYCMEYLCEHIEWIQNKIAELDCNYILIDCPGQVCSTYSLHKLFQLDYSVMLLYLYHRLSCFLIIIVCTSCWRNLPRV